MDEKEFRNYKQTRSMIIFSLGQIWPSIRNKIDGLIEETSRTSLDNHQILLLKSVTDDIERKCVTKITEFSWYVPKIEMVKKYERFDFEFQSNQTLEEELIRDVISEFLDIYSYIFDPFIGDVDFIGESNPDLIPDTIKFRYYNIDLRHPKDSKRELKKCDVANAIDLLKLNKHKMELMQGYWRTEAMIREMRNHHEHSKRDGKRFLKTVNRQLVDPISNAETTANVFTLISAVILLSHQFIEILQTWVDTSKLIGTYK